MTGMLRRIIQVSGKESRRLALPVALSLLDSLLHMGMFAVMVTTIIDLVKGDFSGGKLGIYTAALAAMFVLRAVLGSIGYAELQYRGSDVTTGLRLRLGDHIRSLNMGYFNKNSIGKLSAVLTTDIADFETALTHSLSLFCKTVFFTALALIFAFGIDWRFGLGVLALTGAALPLLIRAGTVSSERAVTLRSSVEAVVSRVLEYLNGIRTFKLYNLTGEKFEALDTSFRVLKKESIKMELSLVPWAIGFSLVTSCLIPLTLIAGSMLVGKGLLDPASYIIIVMIAISLSVMMSSLGSLYPLMNFLDRAALNILALLEEKPFPFHKEKADCADYGISFEDVSFRYTDDVEVLKHVSFSARPGTTTALVGPSGSGKTTITSLISRFWDVTEGSISIGGEDIRNIAPDGLTERMAVVFQDVYLLNDTVLNNIRVGKPGASREEVEKAAQAACCHDFIMAMPEGYDTMVGEGGSTLSGGERQRISIARALVKDAPIVLLDETTSSLDADNEAEINRAFDSLVKGKTVIVIAHRLGTIIGADTILVLEGGRIAESGNHNELVRRGGWYARMYEEQKKAKNWRVSGGTMNNA
ncbi:MAG: ABC transporter ATP-binding protein/permease [Spirochaetaceae bacterium]|jgi:ATP-binding cassette subfamily B protein|nr:ABC transporter ATP-binding protein/permease [Spirochaetaceae bacterium]